MQNPGNDRAAFCVFTSSSPHFLEKCLMRRRKQNILLNLLLGTGAYLLVGGGFANETFKGTFTVNPNCTGTTTVQFFQSGVLVRTSVLALVFDDLSTQLRLVQKSLTLPDGTKVPVVITAEGKKLGGD
jgi:hypothetical protein